MAGPGGLGVGDGARLGRRKFHGSTFAVAVTSHVCRWLGRVASVWRWCALGAQEVSLEHVCSCRDEDGARLGRGMLDCGMPGTALGVRFVGRFAQRKTLTLLLKLHAWGEFCVERCNGAICVGRWKNLQPRP